MPPLSEDHDGNTAIERGLFSPPLKSSHVEMNRLCKVQFEDVHAMKLVDTVPTEYRSEYWMSKKEFDAIRKDAADTAARARVDSSVDTRGLESSVMTGEAFLKRYLHRRGALRAVLKEQVYQRETTGLINAESIANVYGDYSRKSTETARAIADQDALVVLMML